jgi:hypothetical protein
VGSEGAIAGIWAYEHQDSTYRLALQVGTAPCLPHCQELLAGMQQAFCLLEGMTQPVTASE